jgi:hypothetical protein
VIVGHGEWRLTRYIAEPECQAHLGKQLTANGQGVISQIRDPSDLINAASRLRLAEPELDSRRELRESHAVIDPAQYGNDLVEKVE